MAATATETPAAASPASKAASGASKAAPAASKADVAAPTAGKPPKPDEDQFKKDLAEAEKLHKVAMEQLNQIREKVDSVSRKTGKDAPLTPAQQRRQELIAESAEIRQKQGGAKNARTAKMDQVKRLDEQLRSRVNEQKTARSKVSFRSVEELDDRIADLDGQVATGKMKLVDEKKALNEISMLRKTRKTFGQFDDQQKQIDDLRAKIKEIKDSMDTPENKALSDRYTIIQTELDQIKAEQDETYKNLSSLRDERSCLQAEQQKTYARVRDIQNAYYSGRRAFQDYEREAREKANERRRLERERFAKERKRAEAESVLADASYPAFSDEIRRAHSLLRFLDPTFEGDEKSPLQASSVFGAEPLRKIDSSEPAGMKLVRKEDREEDMFISPAKKNKKGKKKDPAAAAASAPSKYSCPPSVMADCASMGINPPMSQADVSDVVDKVKTKLAYWKDNQKSQTEKNIAKAKREIERLEREDGENDGASASKDAEPADKTSEPADEAAAKLEQASLEDEGKPADADAEEDKAADAETDEPSKDGADTTSDDATDHVKETTED